MLQLLSLKNSKKSTRIISINFHFNYIQFPLTKSFHRKICVTVSTKEKNTQFLERDIQIVHPTTKKRKKETISWKSFDILNQSETPNLMLPPPPWLLLAKVLFKNRIDKYTSQFEKGGWICQKSQFLGVRSSKTASNFIKFTEEYQC